MPKVETAPSFEDLRRMWEKNRADAEHIVELTAMRLEQLRQEMGDLRVLQQAQQCAAECAVPEEADGQ